MEYTECFLHTHEREDRKGIQVEWIERVVAHPAEEQVQRDGRIRRWGRIPEAGGKWLRVALLEDKTTLHNAFFDRSFGGK